MTARASVGGAAAAGGMDFQHRGAAWVAVHILGEKNATTPWDLPAGVTLEWLRCETEQPVDDLLVGTSDNGLIFAQFKRTIQLSKAANSYLASALDQFVRQFVTCRGKTTGTQPWERPLDLTKDRLVLITSPSSYKPIRICLRDLLRQVRQLHSHQKLDDAANNEDERRALSVARAHITKSWQKSMGVDPTDVELRQLFSLIRVEVMDLDGGGAEEREAKNILRTAVLKNPAEADTAWTKLISLCTGLAAQGLGADRMNLQRELLKAGLPLKAPRSYQDDIEKLREFSEITFDALADLAQIRVGSTRIKIQRLCTQALQRASAQKSVLVVGEPGAGKSGALHDFVEALRQDGRDYVFLAVDRLATRSLGELRAEIGLVHELPKVLDNWQGLQPAFIVIDAMDAASADPAGKMIRDLIRQVVENGSRWHVVASIRKFDLRYGVEIKGLFTGPPPTEFYDPEFKAICHLKVPSLSEEELNQVALQSAELHALIHSTSTELHDLLHVLFNLRLIGELLGVGVSPDELTPIRTQLDLLERYWLHRVIRSDQQGDTREALLHIVCEKMVEERALHVDRSAIIQQNSGTLLNDLLSTQVLIEWQPSPEMPPDRYILAFAHHMLFDYSVARLLLRGDPEKVVHRLSRDPELVIVIRPSLLLHFRYLCTIDNGHKQYWGLVLRIIQADGIPEIGKLIGPCVASELSRALSDLEPLLASLEGPDAAIQNAAEKALGHIIGALLARGSDEMKLLGPGAGPWCELLERVSRSLKKPMAYMARSLLKAICSRPEDFTPEQRAATGQTARRLLEFAWAHSPMDSWLVIHALQCVCRTFESDPAASAVLIRRCMDQSHLSQFGFEEIPWLAQEVKRLIPIDPELVEEIYRVVFSHLETSTEPTPLGQDRILPLISNRRQDYEMALHALAAIFPKFLKETPERATRALITVVEAYVSQRHSRASAKWHEEMFEFEDQKPRVRIDYSAVWDEGDTYCHDEPLKMLDAFQQHLEGLAACPDTGVTIRQLVQVFVSNNRLAVLWRRLLLVGARFPSTVGKAILPLTWATPILTCIDTTTPAGDLIKAIIPTLSSEDRKRIEQAILSIPDTVPSNSREEAKYIRNRLLGCLADESIVTDRARDFLTELKYKNSIPPNEPPVRFGRTIGGPDGEEWCLRHEGVPVDAEPNRKIQELVRPVKDFADNHRNSIQTLQEASALLPALQALHKALSQAEASGVHPKQRDYAWGYLAAACSRIARTDALTCNDGPDAFVTDALLEASRHHDPTHHPEYDAQFDEHPSWDSLAVRIEAAEWLVVLARQSRCVRHEVLEAIERLSTDPMPAVRYQIASKLNALCQTAQELMWRLIERMCREEQSCGVLHGLLSWPLNRLAGVEADRIARFVKEIYDRISEGPGASEVQECCVSLLARIYIWQNHVLSREVVLDIVTNPATNLEKANHVLTTLREPITHGPTDRSDSKADAVRQRALELLKHILRSAREAWGKLEIHYADILFSNWPKHEQDKAKSLLRLIDGVGSEVYFASGAFDAKRHGKPGEALKPKPESERFYKEAGIIIDELAESGLPSVSHHLLEALDYFVPLYPKDVFLRIGQVVRSGAKGGYQYESLAADLIVTLVERYLSEYRLLMREDEECCRTLIELLDVFVQAGWPSARRLTYRLEEIFR